MMSVLSGSFLFGIGQSVTAVSQDFGLVKGYSEWGYTDDSQLQVQEADPYIGKPCLAMLECVGTFPGKVNPRCKTLRPPVYANYCSKGEGRQRWGFVPFPPKPECPGGS